MVRKGRSPCCDKTKVKRGPWSPAEDARLVSFIMEHGHTNWRALPQQAGLLRCGKSCRLRWINYLRPDVKRGNFSPEEEEIIINLHNSMGNKWSMIAAKLPGRTDNEIKNVWNTHLKKKVCRNGATTTTTTTDDLNRSKDSSTGYSSSASASSGSCISYGDINRQSDGYRVSAAVMESDQNQEPNKGESESLSPCNSYISTTNVQSLIGGVVEEEPEPTSTTTTNETKEEAKISEEKIIKEIPSDNDVEFWNWFESLTNPILPRDEQQPCEEFEGQERESQKMMVEEGGEEYKKWLKYLENELGLADFGGEESENDDLMFRSEMWPSPPPSHGFGI